MFVHCIELCETRVTPTCNMEDCDGSQSSVLFPFLYTALYFCMVRLKEKKSWACMVLWNDLQLNFKSTFYESLYLDSAKSELLFNICESSATVHLTDNLISLELAKHFSKCLIW